MVWIYCIDIIIRITIMKNVIVFIYNVNILKNSILIGPYTTIKCIMHLSSLHFSTLQRITRQRIEEAFASSEKPLKRHHSLHIWHPHHSKNVRNWQENSSKTIKTFNTTYSDPILLYNTYDTSTRDTALVVDTARMSFAPLKLRSLYCLAFVAALLLYGCYCDTDPLSLFFEIWMLAEACVHTILW